MASREYQALRANVATLVEQVVAQHLKATERELWALDERLAELEREGEPSPRSPGGQRRNGDRPAALG